MNRICVTGALLAWLLAALPGCTEGPGGEGWGFQESVPLEQLWRPPPVMPSAGKIGPPEGWQP